MGESRAEATRFFGIAQARMSNLMCGKISLFSLEALINMATVAGLGPIPPSASPKWHRSNATPN